MAAHHASATLMSFRLSCILVLRLSVTDVTVGLVSPECRVLHSSPVTEVEDARVQKSDFSVSCLSHSVSVKDKRTKIIFSFIQTPTQIQSQSQRQIQRQTHK